MYKQENQPVPFQSIEEAARTTGLSTYYLRQGCRSGTVPHVMCGTSYKVNVPALLKQLGVPCDYMDVMQGWRS